MKTTDLKATPLFNEHLKLKARMVPFAGWNMPVQYAGIIAEHTHTRTQVSLFDICHMGEFYIKGEPEGSGLARIFSFPIRDMSVGKCRYGPMLNERGGIKDDLIVYRLSSDEWMIVVNSATVEKDAAHIKGNLAKNTVFEDRSDKTAKLDLQGPLAPDVVTALIHTDVTRLKYYTFGHFDILGERNIISRTGYTGEAGYELYVSAEKAVSLWDHILGDERVRPAGLGARDTLRLEMGYSLYGQDVTEDTTPLEGGLQRFVDFSKDFIGKSALVKQKAEGVQKLLVAFKSDSRRAPRHDDSIFNNGKEIGKVTSGSFSPTLLCGIGLGYVDADYADTGRELTVKHGPAEMKVKIAERPFYKHGSARK